MKKLLMISIVVVLALATSVDAANTWTTLDVQGDKVRIYRDEFGTPHIFAETNRGLFEGYGYAIAEDRLWQLELFRRASQGRLAEIFGETPLVTNIGNQPALTALAVDRDIRTRFYTEAEVQEMVAALGAEESEIFSAYAAGINRYITEVIAPDPASKLPFEFHLLGIGAPAPWSAYDVVTNAVYQARFGTIGGMERRNRTLLDNLIRINGGAAAGLAVFNDVRWVNDPDAPVSVPAEEPVGKRLKADPPSSEQLEEVAVAPDSMEEDSDAVLQALGVPTTIGSYGWAVSAAHSTNGSPMLFGAPQVNFNTPELFHEIHLKGGNGFNVMGRAFAGVPIIFNGRTDHMSWTMTSGVFGDSRDIYIETLCAAGTGYLYNGVCTPFESRVEIIKVKGKPPVNFPVLRTVHGPVIQGADRVRAGVCSNPCYSQKRFVWKREMESEKVFFTINRARSLQEFDGAVRQLEITHNFVYADKVGNIAYWMSGKVPIRAAGFDARFPLPGTGIAEWTNEFRPVPYSINPGRGWLTSWNTKPTVDYPNPDQRSFGKQYRSMEIDQRLANGSISYDDMKDIAKDIARTDMGGDGRESRFLKPYLFAALDLYPPTNPLAGQARSELQSWDGSLFSDAVSSTTLDAGQVIFAKWLSIVQQKTFGDELGVELSQATSSMLIHVLDDTLGSGSGVPPSRDYFNGKDPNSVMSAAFDQALTELGPDPAAWSSQPRDITRFRHTLYPDIPEVATMLEANRGAYSMVIVLANPRPTSESILSLGQSGFIARSASGAPEFHPHFKDQFELFKAFVYKTMHLYRNTQLQE